MEHQRLSESSPLEVLTSLREQIASAYAPERLGEMSLLVPPKEVGDDPRKLLIPNDQGRPIGVLFVSQPSAPDLIAHGVRNAAQVKERLGPDLGRVILDPVVSGLVQGVSYAVYPWRQPLSMSRWFWPIQRAWLRPQLFGWLRRIAEVASVDADPETDFLAPLRYMAGRADLSQTLRAEAQAAAERLAAGTWKPRLALAHNDLLKENVLLDRRVPARFPLEKRFVVIDWLGANLRGYPMCDLVYASWSFHLGRPAFLAEIDAHCRIHECAREDAKGYFLAGMGYLATHLGHFPETRFRLLSELALGLLRRMFG